MSNEFVVFHADSTIEIASYKRLFDAQRHAAKENAKAARYNYEADAVVYEREFYQNYVVHLVRRINLIGGKEFWEPSNTPNYCSPSSESYWSM